MVFDGLGRDVELGADLLVRAPGDDELGDRELALGQAARPVRGLRLLRGRVRFGLLDG